MRYAYLIMAHNDFKILEKTLLLIDDECTDIYIHIDKKVKSFDFDYFKNLVKKSNIYFTKRINVKWGTYSQIKCEYILFKEAHKNHYDYYHLISGADMPVVSNKSIYDFFLQNKGKEFVSFDNHKMISENALERIKYYHFFVSFARSNNKFLRKLFDIFQYRGINLQKKLKINRLKNCNLKFRKGANWVSVTDNFVSYILDKEKLIKRYFRFSYCADELFVQTLLFNSEFYKNVYSLKNDDYFGIKRYIDWNRGQPYTFTEKDFDLLKNSGCFWVRKITTKNNCVLDEKIFNYIKEKNNGES